MPIDLCQAPSGGAIDSLLMQRGAGPPMGLGPLCEMFFIRQMVPTAGRNENILNMHGKHLAAPPGIRRNTHLIYMIAQNIGVDHGDSFQGHKCYIANYPGYN